MPHVPQPSVARPLGDPGPALWKRVDAFGWTCLIAGMTVSGAPHAFEHGGLWPWAWGVVGAGVVLSAFAQGRGLRAALVGPPGAAGAASDPGPRAG
jgi:hypothetical protein